MLQVKVPRKEILSLWVHEGGLGEGSTVEGALCENETNLEQQSNVKSKNKFGELKSLGFKMYKATVIKKMVLVKG